MPRGFALAALLVPLAGACGPTGAPASPPEAVAPTAAPADPQPPPAPVEAPAPSTPAEAQALYAACRERVEGPEQRGECAVDADCAVGGCSGEVCAPAAAVAGLLGTCEILPCFQVLQACGCHEGACTWTVAPGARPLTPVPVPGGAPPSAPAP